MNPLIQKENVKFDDLELLFLSQNNQSDNIRKYLPESLEKYLPQCIIFYGNPHLVFDKNFKNFKIKIDYPVTDYYLRHFREHYKIKEKRPAPKDMLNAMSGDINTLYNKCTEYFMQNSGAINDLKNFKQ